MKYFYTLLILSFLFSCQKQETNEENEKNPEKNIISFSKEKVKLADIETGKLLTKHISEKIHCKGKIIAKPQNRYKYSAKISGYIKKIHILNGQSIKKGHLLLSLEDPSYIETQKDYLKIKSKTEFLKKEFERQKTLSENNAGTGKIYEKSKTEYEQSLADFEAIKLTLKMININPDKLNTNNIRSIINLYAPIKGNINELNISTGQYVKPEDVLLEIINNEDFLIELNVFEKDIHKIQIGQLLYYDCSISGSKDSMHTAEIISIGNYVDPETKTFKVQAAPKENYNGMRHGIFVNAQINLSENKLKVLPDEAVFFDDGISYAYIAENDTVFYKQEVNTGISENGFTEIKNSELFEKTFIIKGANYIKAEFEKE